MINVGVTSIVGSMRENILRQFSHVMGRDYSEALRVVMEINVDDKSDKEDEKVDRLNRNLYEDN